MNIVNIVIATDNGLLNCWYGVIFIIINNINPGSILRVRQTSEPPRIFSNHLPQKCRSSIIGPPIFSFWAASCNKSTVLFNLPEAFVHPDHHQPINDQLIYLWSLVGHLWFVFFCLPNPHSSLVVVRKSDPGTKQSAAARGVPIA